MTSKLGVAYVAIGGFMFAAFTAFVQLLADYSSYVVVGHRVIWGLLVVLLFALFRGNLKALLAPLFDKSQWLDLVIGAILIAPQYWIFAWAPVNGYILDFALAYFLLPLILIFVGQVFHRNSLSILQWLGVALAALGVLYAFINYGGMSWVVLWCCTGMTLYILHKKRQKIPVLSSFVIENIIMLPVALVLIVNFSDANHPFDFPLDTLFLFFSAGLIASLGLLLCLEGSNLLPLALFGILSYVEPTLIFFTGLLIGASVTMPVTYIAICLGLLLTAFDGMYNLYKGRYSNRVSTSKDISAQDVLIH